MIMRRRPLLRAAAVAGGAYMVHKTADQRAAANAEQDARISQLEQQQAAPPAATAPSEDAGTGAGPAGASLSDQLGQLTKLHDQGILTDEEFSAAKAKVLGI
jgi:putative oligomerization/nucleic acid binding protein